MWFPFFQSKEDTDYKEEGFVDVHHEKTQKICSKPSVKYLESGHFMCSDCGKLIPLDSEGALSVKQCPYCESPNFVPQKIKNYWLYEPLGGGGMGSVYHAFYDEDPDVELAVKILPRKRKNDEYLINSLLREAEIGYTFGEHPHIVQVYDYGYADNEYFAASEFVEGVRLDHIINSPVRRPLKQVVLWALQILSAEQHMFDCGYLFRDLKPQNIIIDLNGNARLFDFGLACTIEEALNQDDSDTLEGSPFYLPPERIVGAGESQCSEIYSLGMVLFHLLAGKPYYSAEELKKLVSKHVTSMRISDVGTKLPHGTSPELIRVLNKMIMRTPSQRYQSYKEVARELFKIYKKTA